MDVLVIFILTAAGIALGMLGMAVGVILRRPCLRGSCGGAGCGACPRAARTRPQRARGSLPIEP